jgi:hypothetical protein
MTLKEHEKFIAFSLLGLGLIGLAVMAYVAPMRSVDTSSIQIINTIVGALTLAFGGAANALFRISDSVKVDNPPEAPVHTDNVNADSSADGEVPDYAR